MQSSPDNPLYQLFLEGRPGWPPIDKWHHYFDVYHHHFAPFRGRQPTVLEIGVQNGGSPRRPTGAVGTNRKTAKPFAGAGGPSGPSQIGSKLALVLIARAPFFWNPSLAVFRAPPRPNLLTLRPGLRPARQACGR